ncbi:MAG: ACP S-malonyltransferase [Cocleimonas sp.]
MQFAAVFPGQGSQSLGMLAELASVHPEIKNTFEEASDILGKNLWDMTTADSNDTINLTVNTQPLMLAAGVAVWKIWQKGGGCLPVAMAGHSLGEYSALVASGALAFDDGIRLVSKRARFMQEAVPAGEGAMAAILGLEDNQIIDICSNTTEGGIVEAVNFNSPGQVVIAGNTKTVDIAISKLTEAGAKRAVKLPVSVPFHCNLLKEAAEKFKQELSKVEFKDTEYNIVQNFEAKSYKSNQERKDALSEQFYKPVLWVDCINNLSKDYNADTIIEFGPGKVLFGLNRRINRSLGNICISDSASLEKALAMCNA